MFSARSHHDAQLNALSIALQKTRREGREVLDLTVSNPTRAGLPYAREAIVSALSDPRALDYAPEPFGIAPARATLAEAAKRHGRALDPSRVMITASTSEAYSFLFKLLCDPGDEVLVPVPSYPLFEHLAAFESVRLVPYPLAYDGVWHLDLPALTRAIGSRTRAILVVSPNNPTGSYVKRDELRALAATGLPIVSDEVFAHYPLRDDPTRAWSALDAADEASLVFAMEGLSKLTALPQMKLAWTWVGGRDARVVDEALARLELIADSFLSVSAPVQHALPVLLKAGRVAADGIRARTAANLIELRRQLGGAGRAATLLDCEGGWYATLRLPLVQSEEAWTLELLESDGVHVHPGHFFDFAREAYAVLSLLTPEPTFREGVSRLLARVDARS